MKERTRFAPAERASPGTIGRQARVVTDTAFLQELFDAVNEEILVLNKERQIVFCNREFSDALGLADRAAVHGLRPGEALHCVHAAEGHAGCGTAEFCQACGAVEAILRSQKGETAVRECRIQQEPHGESLDLKVKASPLSLDGSLLTVVAIQDISHEKRRRALEQIFFHDILNTVMSIRLNSELMEGSDPEETTRLQASVVSGVNLLVKEIQAQKALMAAEADELPLKITRFDALAPLRETAQAYEHHKLSRDRRVLVDAPAKPQVIRSDKAILLRALENLTKNALEAASPGETVTLGCANKDGGIEYWVRNPGVIPRNVQFRIFQRSFSTKGPGRGLGTYSVKLLTEKYLKGKASFSTSEDAGTIFTVWCPPDIRCPEGPRQE
jgi:signal transduction histidine kinase